MNQLFAQLLKELKRSPAKAAVLGGGTLLAIWFWFPLITGWFGLGESSAASTAAPAEQPAEEAPSLAAVPAPEPAAATGQPPLDWRAIAAWRESHPQADTFAWMAGTPNPFVTKVKPEDALAAEGAEQEADDPPVAAAVEADQRQAALAALRLTSTLITSQGRSATINGKVYREGDPIPLGAEGDETPAGESPITLKHVAARSVTLQHGNELIPLELIRTHSKAIHFEFR